MMGALGVMDIQIHKLTHVGTVSDDSTDVVTRKGLHAEVMSLIGEDYQRTHWNDKSQGVTYEYTAREGTRFEVAINAEAAPGA